MAQTDSTSGIKARLAEVKQLEKDRGPEEAEKRIIALIREFPEAHQAYAALARVLMRQGKGDYATRAAEKAAALSPLDARLQTLLGVARMRNDDLEGATAAFGQAIEIDGNFAPAVVGAAAVKMADENFDDALALCDKALDLDPTLERAQELVARIRMKQGKPEEAAEELRRILEKDSASDRALRAYMRLMRKEGRLDEVVSLADLNLSTEPASPQSVARYARMVAFAGKPELAVAQYRKLLESGAAREVDRVRFIAALVGNGELDEARNAIGELKDRRAMKPLKEKLAGDIELAAGRPDEAIGLYLRACRSARIEPPADDDPASQSPEERAKAIQSHTSKALRDALRDLRSEKAAQAK